MLRYIVTIRYLAGESATDREWKDQVIEELVGLCRHDDGLRLQEEEGHSLLMRFLEFRFPTSDDAARLHMRLLRHCPMWTEIDSEVEVRDG